MTIYPDPLGLNELHVSPDGLGGFNVYVGATSSDASFGMTLPAAQAPRLARQLAPVVIPDRDDLAFELFAADNWRQSRAASRKDWADNGRRHYAYVLADAAIEQFKQANR